MELTGVRRTALLVVMITGAWAGLLCVVLAGQDGYRLTFFDDGHPDLVEVAGGWSARLAGLAAMTAALLAVATPTRRAVGGALACYALVAVPLCLLSSLSEVRACRCPPLTVEQLPVGYAVAQARWVLVGCGAGALLALFTLFPLEARLRRGRPLPAAQAQRSRLPRAGA